MQAVGVIGAGQMGAGIAQVSAQAGYRVLLSDVSQEVAEKAEGLNANTNAFKEPAANLRRQGYIDTKEGRGGGSWLTKSGQDVAKKL